MAVPLPATFPSSALTFPTRGENSRRRASSVPQWLAHVSTHGTPSGRSAGRFSPASYSFQRSSSKGRSISRCWSTSVCAMLALLLVSELRSSTRQRRSAALVTVATLFRPQPPVKLLRTSPLNVADRRRHCAYGVGRSASVIALEQNGMLVLRTNGLSGSDDGNVRGACPGSAANSGFHHSPYWRARR